MYRIRFHGRGGQGIKTAGRILGTAFFEEGYEVQDAPIYGAERRGAPMFAYVRAARTPIQERGVVTHPDLVVVADETLVPIPAANVMLGVTANTVLLLNSAELPDTWRQRLNTGARVITLPVAADAVDRANLPHIGTRCAGAAARLLGVVSRGALERALRAELGALGEPALRASLTEALDAFDAMATHEAVVREGSAIGARDYTVPDWTRVPFEPARVAAPDIFAPATSVQVRTGLWRTLRPVIDYAHCHRCVWVCSTLCPDSAIHVRADGAPEIDYDHCKGCLLCAAVCPPHAIQAVPELEAARAEKEAATNQRGQKGSAT